MRNDQSIKFIGLDVHKDSISLAIAENGSNREVRLYGTIKNTTEALDKVIRKLISTGSQLQFVYEARPLWLRDLPPSHRKWIQLHGSGPITDSPEMWRPN